MKLLLLLLLLVLASPSGAAFSSFSVRQYSAIFNFGDSFADNGNSAVILGSRNLSVPMMHPPYGMSFFGHPTGRCSDGRIILDFVASKLGLPFVPPFLAHNGSFRHGANFAVAASTVHDADFYINIAGPVVLASLNMQLQWFESLKPSLCGAECRNLFHKSLFLVGEIGVNDYIALRMGEKSLQEIRSFVPGVIRTVSMAIERLIEHGARALAVPGILPAGCLLPILSAYPSDNVSDYDSTGCLRGFNELAVYHNSLLQEAVKRIQRRRPGVRIVYVDFYYPVMEMIESPAKFGFIRDVLRCCCGGGGRYNFNMSAGCGTPRAMLCEDPSAYLYWDAHYTDAASGYIADGWLNSIGALISYPAQFGSMELATSI